LADQRRRRDEEFARQMERNAVGYQVEVTAVRSGLNALPEGVQGQPTGVWSWPAIRHRAGLVLDARVRNLSAPAQAGGL